MAFPDEQRKGGFPHQMTQDVVTHPDVAPTTGPASYWDRPNVRGSSKGAPRPAIVLVVENEDSNRMLMEKILGFAGYRCISACDGQQALDAFDQERPDIVLTDIAMPVMDGLAAIASIRARPGGANVPIVAVSAYAMHEDREIALRQGCDEYLVKPYRPQDLLRVVARLLQEAGA